MTSFRIAPPELVERARPEADKTDNYIAWLMARRQEQQQGCRTEHQKRKSQGEEV